MINGHCIFNYLNAKEEFWYWGLNHIEIDDKSKSLSFTSMREGNNIHFEISIGDNGFSIKLFKPTQKRKKLKLIKHYNSVKPNDLCDLISSVVFHEEAA